MDVVLDPHKSVNDNIAAYYEKAKKAKAKIAGLMKAMLDTERLIKAEEEKASLALPPEKRVVRSKEWYESFHWFFTTNGLLVVAGRDAKSNDVAVARHLEKDDLYFHADIQGAPSTIMKNGQKAGEEDIAEAASFAASYSSAWKKGAGTISVYYVKPEQVSKTAPSGEYVPKGGFMIRGQKQYAKNARMQLWISYFNGKLQTLPYKPTEKSIALTPGGSGTKNEVAKRLLKAMTALFPEGNVDLDWLMQRLPNGSSTIKE
jgi:predicted ribosome quality control (RQC) complex YloA/Tae2 family protein